MDWIADLHIHSHYSRATSRLSNLEGLAVWAAIKGIDVVGTGDFTHPAWFAELREKLVEAAPGMYRLRAPEAVDVAGLAPPGLAGVDPGKVCFVLTAEISSIYKRRGRVRKIHNVLLVPDFADAARINRRLAGIGNLEADGRPILGLDSRNLLEILLENSQNGFLVPAHIWTPWFSLFGSKSGFDRLEDCFDDLSAHVFALETGLSSDPDMNRLVSALDRYTLISNSDCHSPQKLGREANLFATDKDFFSMREAIRVPQQEGVRRMVATIEFYPEEGKYHCDGHRRCQVCYRPEETEAHGGRCPVCGRLLTIGVLHRVMDLADREAPVYPAGSPAVHSLIPLPEILAELLGVGPNTKKVATAYGRALATFGSEFTLLLQTPLEEIRDRGSAILAEAIGRVRQGRVIRQPGYDGQFGTISVFGEQERSHFLGQLNLFGTTPKTRGRKKQIRRTVLKKKGNHRRQHHPIRELNPEQQAAVDCDASHILVQAGPGTGKTHVLVQRVCRLLAQPEERATVITFTNRAADEIRQRLITRGAPAERLQVATLHGYCLNWLRERRPGLAVVGPRQRSGALGRLAREGGLDPARLEEAVTDFLVSGHLDTETASLVRRYFERLDEQHSIDIQAIVPCMVARLRQDATWADQVGRRTGGLFIDEFQDLNASQYELVRLLGAHTTVFAIGDPDQAIYGFRGSSPRWFFRFSEDFQASKLHLLRNYRSADTLLRAAFSVIGHNRQPVQEPEFVAVSDRPGRIHALTLANPAAEARAVAQRIEQLLGGTSHREIDLLGQDQEGGLTLADIGILYRTTAQATPMATELARRGLPFQVVGLTPFYLHPPCLVPVLWLLVAADQASIDDLLHLLEHEPGLGSRTRALVEEEISAGAEGKQAALGRALARARGSGKKALANFLDFLQYIRKNTDSPQAVFEQVVGRYHLDLHHPDMVRLLRMQAAFPTLAAWAEHLQKHRDSVVYDAQAEAITLMTLHAAKGLEFTAVFILGTEEGLLPLQAPGSQEEDTEGHLQEERRLFFVGMTRATSLLYLCRVRTRKRAGRWVKCQVSRFVNEFPPELLSREKRQKTQDRRQHHRQLSLF